jgi:transcriptional regulator with XRE-family HTH domain
MNPATGTHCVRRLREFLGLKQDGFAREVDVSASMIHKIENEKTQKLSPRLAERIASFTGVSVQWLLRNHPAAPLVDPFGNRYTKNHYLRARSLRRDPRLLGLILGARTTVRMQLLQNYAKARALFDRPEMRQHFLRYIAELELLRGRFEDKALYSEGTTAGDLIVEEAKLLATDSLFPGVIADARKCQQAIKTARERKKMREESLGALEPASESSEPVRQTKAQRGRELVRKRIRESVAERHK